jgi:hypothetical protein
MSRIGSPGRRARFWKATSVRSRVVFAVAVFCMFGAMRVLVDVAQPAHTPIHDALVPTVSGRSGNAEYYGRSQASGAMGGDLVDVFEGGTTLPALLRHEFDDQTVLLVRLTAAPRPTP